MKRLIFILLLLASSFSLHANGGIHWWENGTGTSEPAVIILKNDSDIILKKENLSLHFVDDSVIVNCDYVLNNRSENEKVIDFAFNITDGPHAALQYYHILVEGRKLDSELHTDVIEDETYFYRYWELSEIRLGAEKETKVSVSYRVDTQNDGTYYKSNFNDSIFIYNLFPALSFGNGIIEDFSITIDASDILGWNGKITGIEGIDIPFRKSERTVTKAFKNFDLNKNRQLKISYNIKNFYFAKLYKKYGFRIYGGVTATSELKEDSTTYSARNLMDNNCKTAWVEANAGFGKNERIKINVTGILSQVLIVNGFRKSEKTYYENNRVKKIAFYVDDVRLGEITFPDRPYHQVSMSNILDEGELINCNSEFFKKTSDKTLSSANAFVPENRIVIEILEVYPGTKYNDTCISDIYLIKAPLPVP